MVILDFRFWIIGNLSYSNPRQGHKHNAPRSGAMSLAVSFRALLTNEFSAVADATHHSGLMVFPEGHG
jgi:hypothetical protein